MVNLHFVAGLRFYCRKVLVSGFNGSHSQLKKKKKESQIFIDRNSFIAHCIYAYLNLHCGIRYQR